MTHHTLTTDNPITTDGCSDAHRLGWQPSCPSFHGLVVRL